MNEQRNVFQNQEATTEKREVGVNSVEAELLTDSLFQVVLWC